MRILEAEAQLIRELTDEIEVVGANSYSTFTVVAGRHPTLGRVVIVRDQDGNGLIVEAE
jgi:hypothetical protein